tara:strand:- start:1147 stop:1389 length:243 start_codon:yes stop_codon:yes gene_type:complete
MIYYLLLNGDTDKDLINETNILGEESFSVFYPSLGFNMLNKIINTKPELLDSISIKDEQNKSYTITEFLDLFNKWRIKKA